MARFILRQLRFRRGRAAALGVTVVIATSSFALLASAARSSEIRVSGSVESNYRTAYDILVRPRGAASPIERTQGLVVNNYLSGLFGGITLKQWREIKQIPRVETAAPIANIGFVIPEGFETVRLDSLLNDDPVQVYRVTFRTLAHASLSRYELRTSYVYYTRRNQFTYNASGNGVLELAGEHESLYVCGAFTDRIGNVTHPFRRPPNLSCYSERSPGEGSDTQLFGQNRVRRGEVAATTSMQFPIMIAGIDPVEEKRLLALDDTIVSGRYLRPNERPRLQPVPDYPTRGYHRLVPVIASARTYVDEYIEARIERLRIPASTNVARMLASDDADVFLTALEGEAIARRVIPPQALYASALSASFGGAGAKNTSASYWTASPVRYGSSPETRLRPIPAHNPLSTWSAEALPHQSAGYIDVPPANEDIQFRRLEAKIGSPYWDRFEVPDADVYKTPVMLIVGRYDPEKLPGFSPLSRVPLETYYPPELLPADEASRRALDGKPLLPSQNIGDYVAQPPLFLTTLEGMRPFLRPKYYAGASEAAPVSVIRVRVAGVTGPDELSQARVRAVATEIHKRTGLQVDITAGSSPRRLLVELPPGKFGRPKLLLEEGWSKKGVSVSFLQALDSKRLGLLSLILLTSAFFLANGAFAAVRGRRTEIGTLLCLGWSQRAIFRVVLAELALAGLVAGVAGAAVAALAARLLDLELSAARALLVVPLALALALVAGSVPAWRASRLEPLDAIRPPVWAKTGRRRVTRLTGLALANLRRMPARSLVAMFGLFVGVGALTVLLAVNQAFQGQLVGTLLGEAISVQVRGLDFLTVGLIVVLAGLSLADVLYLNLRERAAELVTLRTVGWSDGHLGFVIALEALLLGLLAALAGAAVGVITGAQLGVPLGPLALAAAAGVAGGCLIALLASLLPLAHLTRLTAPTVLAEE